MPTLTQQSSLATALSRGLKLPFTPIFELMEKITEKQYKLLWALIFKKDGEKLRQVIPEMMKFYQLTNEDEHTNNPTMERS